MHQENENPDPGGVSKKGALSAQEMCDLKDQNDQQLVLIAQLKEMLRKEQSTVSQDKVEEYVNTLTRRSMHKRSDSSSSISNTSLTVNIDANKKERVNLLRQQLEENKARLAQRGKNQKGIEDMVTQLQAQFKDSETLNSPFNISLSSSSVDKKSLEYNETTSQKDLFNILLIKEKVITDLTARNQKLEGVVLDLQENLKEKDSVIDARTKAITLMSDSLSKKSKNTLDALEETKDQMRNMQENFVKLEGDMKARQLALLNDLKHKNFEISELEQENSQLKEINTHERLSPLEVNLNINKDLKNENDQFKEEIEKLKNLIKSYEEASINYKSKISELEQELHANTEKNNENAVVISNLEKQLAKYQSSNNADDNEEIQKLNKQIEDGNKNAIKTRATHKAKIKELNKKLEQFKKMTDSNALIGQLQHDIGKLNEKIAVLEEEKGNFQLMKMVESTTSSKEADTSEIQQEISQLKEDLNKGHQEIEEKDKIIEFLETDVLRLKESLKQQDEESVKVSSQVSTEMSSICYEEQIETLELEKKKLVEEIEKINAEKDDLLKELENIKKDKQELNNSLENYIQENMELIDKLEKLSAEKVSSIESIEIVEGLTQQEKLELSAYQKRINTEEFVAETLNLKCQQQQDDENVESPVELNESVLQLNEDTAELLQKIEMFSHERKEVMQRIESLKEENDNLNIKIKGIETNRDILEETYEQLQNEKEQIESENEKLQKELGELKKKNLDANEPANLAMQLNQLQIKYEAILQENNELKRRLKDFDSMVQEKYDVDQRLHDAIENNDNLDTKLNLNLDEINTYQLTIEENKVELIRSSEVINKLENQLEERENDIQELHMNINELNSVINELQGKESPVETMEYELNNLRTTLEDQIRQTADYQKEISQNSETIKNLNVELVDLNRRVMELENELTVKDEELKKLNQSIHEKDSLIKNLHDQIAEKDQSFRVVSEDIKGKYLKLQTQLENNDGSLQKEISDLHDKNKKQLEKMKVLAAKLKKKTQSYQELEEQFKLEQEKWQNHAHDEIVQLKNEIVNLQQELKNKQEKLHETSLQQEMCESLHEEIDSSYSQQISDDKTRELELVVETNESALNHYKERFEKLQEDFGNLQQENSHFENVKAELLEKLATTANMLNEKISQQERMEFELNEAILRNKELTSKFTEMQDSNNKLSLENNQQKELLTNLKTKWQRTNDQLEEVHSMQDNFEDLKKANETLKNKIVNLEEYQRQILHDYESLQEKSQSDYEKIEADYQIQLEELLKFKSDLTTENEKLLEKIEESHDRGQQQEAEFTEITKTQQEQLVLLVEELEYAKIRSKKLAITFKARETKLQESAKQIEELDKNLLIMSQQTELLQNKVDTISAQNESKDAALKDAYDNFERLLIELNSVKDKLAKSAQEIEELKKENSSLRQDVQALEFAKTTLEASCESLHKLEIESNAENLIDASQNKKLCIQIHPEQISHQKTAAVVSSASETEPESAAVVTEHDKITSSKNIPLFNAFAQNSPDLLFDTFSTIQIKTEADEESGFNLQEPSKQTEILNRSEPETLVDVVKSGIIENGREALLQKIKTLEFLLYNVDKEKEIALDECTEMINALTQIIYDSSSSAKSELENQIVTLKDTKNLVNKQQLVDTEFTPINKISGEQQQVVEENISSKNAYLCYSEAESGPSNIEAQILSSKDIDELSNPKELQKLEFEAVTPDVGGEQQLPVVESLVQPKHAYLCYTKDDKPKSLEAFEENDDGWAWGPEEVRLETEHLNSMENMPQMQNLLVEIQQLKETIKILQVERENYLEEIKQLQIKSGKLIKKCKELKAKNDQGGESSRKKSVDSFFDLNETIQEELKIQVQQLEKKLKELNQDREKDKVEKCNLAKRVDVLTSANDRLIEMKEIQDSEVHRWQRKYEEVQQKIHQEVEWSKKFSGTDDEKSPETPMMEISSSDSAKVKELEDTLKDLILDNEELQALLEEQTAKRLEIESHKTISRSSADEDLTEMRELNQTLHKELEEIKLKEIEFENQVQQILGEKAEIIQEKLELEKAIEKLKEQEKSHLTELNNFVAKEAEKQQEIKNLEIQLKLKTEEIEAQKLLLQNFKDNSNSFNEALENREKTVKELQVKLEELEKIKLDQEKSVHTFVANEAETQQQIKNLEIELKLKNEELEAQEVLLQNFKENSTSFNQTLENREKTIKELQEELEEIKLEKFAKEADATRLKNELQAKEKELEEQVNSLNICIKEHNENWQAQVDQRGSDVAESWKMHLEIVEKDHNLTEEKLKEDLRQIEEKCDILVQENQELRKNVDQEIRNEVDKISAFQQQISNLNQTINGLNQTILEKNTRIAEIETNLENYEYLETELEKLKLENSEKEMKLANIHIIIETTQRQFDEKREVVEEIVKLLEKNASTLISYEKQEILQEFERQLNLHSNSSEIPKLNQQITELEVKLTRISGEKNREITGLNQVIEDLEKELSVIHQKEMEIARLESEIQTINEEKSNLSREIQLVIEEKDNLIVELEKLQQNYSNSLLAAEEITNKKIQNYSNLNETLKNELELKTMEINELNQRILQIQNEQLSDRNKEEYSLNCDLESLKTDYLALQNSYTELQTNLAEVTAQFSDKSDELELARKNFVEKSLQYEKEETNRLQTVLAEKEKEYEDKLQNQNQSVEMMQIAHYEEQLSNKEIDNNALKMQIQELLQSNHNIELQLAERSQLVNEDTKQLEELKFIIEDQVVKIEELKKELFDKSNQYDSLIAEIDVGRAPVAAAVTQQPIASKLLLLDNNKSENYEENLSDPVNRAELDLALYMLHQRDVRCEELTVELTHLLEERDTLQLRLSNAIRENEEMRCRRAELAEELSHSNNLENSSIIDDDELRTSFIPSSSSITSRLDPIDALDHEKNLALKLSELRNVGYKKDKTFVDEQEARRVQQLVIMQEHIKEASKLPAEAAAKLVDASYTLSRDVQSPSKVLLNWLWGKSPPKAHNDTSSSS